jgi:hypothetical protein
MKFINFFTTLNFLKNDKLSKDFYHRISAIILLISGIFALTGIGIFSGLFSLTTLSLMLASILKINQYLFSNID